jgi:hypothetical protein
MEDSMECLYRLGPKQDKKRHAQKPELSAPIPEGLPVTREASKQGKETSRGDDHESGDHKLLRGISTLGADQV